MRALLRRLAHPTVLAAALVLAACGGGTEVEPVGPGPAVGAVAPDFSLEDHNPSSPSFSAQVSPRQLLGKISAWYFGHAT